jgi:periplasmic protein TonB
MIAMHMKKLLLSLGLLASVATLSAQQPIQDGTGRNFTMVSNRDAEYPGGNNALYKHLFQQMQYPAEAKEKKITGDIMVSFMVEADSTTSEVKAMKDLGGGTKEEAERLIKTTKFVPALQNGKPVRQQMMLPVLFRIYE